MKTSSGRPKATPQRALPCCPDQKPIDVVQRLQSVSKAVVAAHTMIAMLYDNLADGYKDSPENRRALEQAAMMHRKMAENSTDVVVPGDVEVK